MIERKDAGRQSAIAAAMTQNGLPFHRLGGRAPIAQLVARFYELMDNEKAYAELRAIHAPDLGPTRESLTDFLIAWTGGPRQWFKQRPGVCVMSAHAALSGMTHNVSRQWIDAMARAMDEVRPGDPEIRDAMMETLTRMANAMASRSAAAQA
ncbi:globin [Sphingopyxis sp. YF1]|uniref:globin domain-containing protein n=1 Tax=Sphingopyxis sp. YF1 TaxID=2482763 RepID=UPI001F61EA50|nr:globin [Sphingopyxis sp. YF1]